jgi:hypothetical protein
VKKFLWQQSIGRTLSFFLDAVIFNIVVDAQVEQSTGNGQFGIDLGLKDTPLAAKAKSRNVDASFSTR